MSLRAILFDLDGTLLDRDSPASKVADAQYYRLVVPFPGAPGCQIWVDRWTALDDHGYVPKTQVYAALLAEWKLGGISARTLIDDFHQTFPAFARGYPGMVAMLKALRRRDPRLGLVTNGSRQSPSPNISALDLDRYLDAILISEVEGVSKPNAEIFRRALARVGVRAGEALFVGDHPVFDIDGAKTVGIKTVWKRSRVWPVPEAPDAVIGALSEIEGLLNTIMTRGQRGRFDTSRCLFSGRRHAGRGDHGTGLVVRFGATVGHPGGREVNVTGMDPRAGGAGRRVGLERWPRWFP